MCLRGLDGTFVAVNSDASAWVVVQASDRDSADRDSAGMKAEAGTPPVVEDCKWQSEQKQALVALYCMAVVDSP